MRLVSRVLGIIGLCATCLLLASCSVVRLGYSQAPDLAFWWIDSYVDLNEAQSPRLRKELDDIAQWHRSRELPEVVLLVMLDASWIGWPSRLPDAAMSMSSAPAVPTVC